MGFHLQKADCNNLHKFRPNLLNLDCIIYSKFAARVLISSYMYTALFKLLCASLYVMPFTRPSIFMLINYYTYSSIDCSSIHKTRKHMIIGTLYHRTMTYEEIFDQCDTMETHGIHMLSHLSTCD